MELNKFLFPLRKWWWLILASTLIAAFFSYWYVLRQPSIYETRTTLMIGTAISDPNPSSNEFALGQQLAAAYANIANRQVVRDGAMSALGMSELPEYIARALPNTQLIEIAVTDTDPVRAQAVANELAAQLMLLSPTGARPEEQGRQEFINERLNILEVQINDTEEEIKNLQEALGDMISAQEIDDTQDQITSLQSKLATMQEIYGVLLSNTQQGAINSLALVEPAALPSAPIGPRRELIVLLAAALGLILAVSEAYLLEYLDNTLKTADEIARLFSAPIIGHIFEQKNSSNKALVYQPDNAHYPFAEAFRVLRTNIEFADVSRPIKTILVTSPDIGDGKTSVAANLAMFIAQKNKIVILLDADMRRPNVHEYLNLPNDRGLADLFLRPSAVGELLKVSEDKRLAVLPAGVTPPNPTELLGSDRMDQLLATLRELADYVIIDAPPFIVADAMILASKVDGVLMVVRPGYTRRPMALVSMERMKVVGARLIGVVLNRIPLRESDYYAGRSYQYTYSVNRGSKAKSNNGAADAEKLRKPITSYADKVAKSFRSLVKDRTKPSHK